MATATLLNEAVFAGTYADCPLTITSTQASTTLITNVSATKVADRCIWLDGLLTYTIVLTNDEDLTFMGLVFTDQLDTTLIQLVPNTVRVDGVLVGYSYAGGLLSLNLPNLPAGGSVSITFQVQKV